MKRLGKHHNICGRALTADFNLPNWRNQAIHQDLEQLNFRRVHSAGLHGLADFLLDEFPFARQDVIDLVHVMHGLKTAIDYERGRYPELRTGPPSGSGKFRP